MNRNAILDAVFSLVSLGEGKPGKVATRAWSIKWTSRKLRLWDDISNKPAICQTSHAETITKDHRLPYKNLIEVEWWVYFDATMAIPDVFVEDALDALQEAIQVGADPDGRQTLGGLVYDVWIEGQLLKVPGDIDKQGLLIVPLKILIP